eukprot:TRINITY_DN14375_c0_g1_i1.p1 TRINITY_DN14375_c0_g1~~TRINITY_DN14375_c0_g1_i1.p1  ORF type:complete len:553 (-),score=61.32 TRINITY_DN14375_c0_g1_i1:1318-2976(-)
MPRSMSFSWVVLLLGLCVDATTKAVPGKGSKPHIVHILIDDFGWANLGYHAQDDPAVKTPNMDKLAAEGLKLERHYVYNQCSPTRSAIQSGRNPVHVNVFNGPPNIRNKEDPIGGYQGIPVNMTGIAQKMKQGGYATHMVGKWDAGMATHEQTPQGRGYDTSLNYFHHANDYWTSLGHGNVLKADCPYNGINTPVVDLWETDGPAKTLNNSWECSQTNQAGGCVYEDLLFFEAVRNIIGTHNPTQPLFLFYAPHSIHQPLEVPQAYYDKFDYVQDEPRRLYSAMVNYIDSCIGMVVDELKRTGLYDNTLIVLHSDNGGPIYLAGKAGANNWPLKGGKLTNWEGGIRVNAFVSGGFLPEARKGKMEEGYVTAWDWYSTFCYLAGVDPTDHAAAAAGLPPIDSLNVWKLISGQNETSPRVEIPAGWTIDPLDAQGGTLIGALISGDYKIILYEQVDACWTGPQWPNVSSHFDPDAHFEWCGFRPEDGCLFNIKADPNEHVNLAKKMPAKWHELYARVQELQKGVYSPNRGWFDPLACKAAMYTYGGFWGPWVKL